MPRFVILRHECPPGYVRPSHWDLMFEVDDHLRTWSFVNLPTEMLRRLGVAADRAAKEDQRGGETGEELGRHRLEYLQLEGPLSGNRGSVARIEAGTFEVHRESSGQWEVRLASSRLSGRLRLFRLESAAPYWRVEWSSE